jgi:hypothetical protein
LTVRVKIPPTTHATAHRWGSGPLHDGQVTYERQIVPGTPMLDELVAGDGQYLDGEVGKPSGQPLKLSGTALQGLTMMCCRI